MTSRKSSAVVPGLFIVLVSSVFIGLGGSGLKRDAEFEKSPCRTTATIDKLWISHGSKGSRSTNAAYHYSIGHDTYYIKDTSPMLATYELLTEGQQVPIKYLPTDPTATRIDWDVENQARWRNDLAGLLVGCAIATVGVLVAFFLYRAQIR